MGYFHAAIPDGDMENENKKKKGKKGKKMTDEERMKKKRALLLGGDSDAEEPTVQPPSLVQCYVLATRFVFYPYQQEMTYENLITLSPIFF